MGCVAYECELAPHGSNSASVVGRRHRQESCMSSARDDVIIGRSPVLVQAVHGIPKSRHPKSGWDDRWHGSTDQRNDWTERGAIGHQAL
jgi:hypothetical protein